MAHEATPELVSFDAGRALERAQSVVAGQVLVFAEITDRDYNIMYVSGEMLDRFDDVEADLFEIADDVHEYEVIDFFERDVVDDLLPVAGEVQAFATFAELVVVVRILTGTEGVYITVPSGTDVNSLVSEVRAVMTRDGVDGP
ncbi:MAG: hypothetical protein ABEJ85_01140 [Haloarculaceae archaeon]